MRAEVTATTSPVDQLSAGQVTVAYVSAYDPDRDLVQQQSSFSTRLPEPQHGTIKVRPKVETSFWIASGQVYRFRCLADLGSSESVRDATIDVRDFPDGIICVSPNTSTGYSTAPGLGNESDPWSEYIAELEEKEIYAKHVRQAYKARIDALRSGAALDGFEVNGASEKDFWSFTGSTYFPRRAGLALMDNGNIRAVWKGE